MAENKGIEFKVKIDETSFARTSRMIADLTQQLKELARVAGGINIPGGTGGTGMLAGIGVTTQRQAGLPTTVPMQGANNVAGILTQGLQADRNLFRTIAEGSKEAMKAMRDGLKQTADEQIRDIKRLKKEIDELAKSYNSINDKSGLGSRLAAGDMSAMLAKGKELQNLQAQHSATQRAMGGGGGGSFLSTFTGMAGIAAGAVGVGMAAIGVHDYGAGLANSRALANYDYQNSQRLAAVQASASQGAALGGLAQQMYQGDIGLAGGFRRALQSGLMRDIAGTRSAREAALRIKTYQNFTNIGENQLADWARAAGFGPDEVRRSMTNLTPQEIQEARERTQIPAQVVQDAVQSARIEASRDPMWNMRANQFYAGASGNLAVQRAFGVGSTMRMINGQMVYQNQAARMEAMANRMGFEVGEAGAAVQAAQGVVGRANRFKGLGFLGKQIGGFSAAADVFALGQEYGSGPGLLRAFAGQGGISGAGGIDPVAASQLAQSVIAQTRGGALGLDPTAAVGGLGAIIGTGGDVGTQMRLMRQMGTGMQAMTADLAGATDPLQSAINAFAGTKAFGNNFYAASAMSRLNATELNQILLSGHVGSRLAGKGVDIGGVRAFANERDRFGLSRFMDLGQTTMEADAVRGARAAGGSMAFIRQQLQGLSGRARRDKFLELTSTLGSARASSLGTSDEQEIASLRVQAAGEGLFGPLSGRGAGDVTSRSDLARQVLGDRATKKMRDALEKPGEAKRFLEEMGVATGAEAPLTGLGESLMKGEKDLTASLERLAFFIDSKILKLQVSPGDYGIQGPPVKGVPSTKRFQDKFSAGRGRSMEVR